MVITNSTVELTRDEIVRLLEDGAQRRRGMTATELICAYRERRLDDAGEVADLLALSYLLKDEDPLLVHGG